MKKKEKVIFGICLALFLGAGAFALGLALLAFDAWEGGLGWRYMIDFAWLLALAALPAFLAIAGAVDSHAPALRLPSLFGMRFLLAAGVVTLLGFYVPGRDDALIGVNSGLYHTVRSWFTLF